MPLHDLYSGTYSCNVDSKGRFSMPSAFRSCAVARAGAAENGQPVFFAIPMKEHASYMVFDGATLAKKIERLDLKQQIEIASRTHRIVLDSAGRIRFEQEMINFLSKSTRAGIKLALVGAFNSFQMMSQEQFEELSGKLPSCDLTQAL